MPELADRLASVEARVSDLELEVFVAAFAQSREGELEPTPYYSSIRWSFRVPYGRFFRMDETGCKEWVGGPGHAAFIRNMCAYDGQNSTRLDFYGRDPLELQHAVCENRPVSGGISPEMEPGLRSFVEGYQLGLPWRGTRTLSDLVRHVQGVQVREVTIAESAGPVYRVFIPFDASVGEPPQCLYLDPARGFAIVRWEHVRQADGTVVKQVFESKGLTEVIDGVWLPAEATYRDLRTKPVEVREFTLTDVRVNRGLEETHFRVEFPPETPVTDRRNGRHVYRIGFTPAELDAMMQTQVKMARDALAKADGRAARRLPLLPPPHEVYASDELGAPRRWAVLVIPAVTGAAAVSAMAWFMRRRKPSRPALALAAAFVVALVFTSGFVAHRSHPEPARSARTLDAPDWERIAPRAKPRPVGPRPAQDCGEFVLCFLAGLYDAGWSAETIAANVESAGGTMSLARICDMLTAMGLRADGVRLSGPEEARDLLRAPDTSLVLVTTVGRSRTAHFFCVLGTSGERFLVADPPRPVHLSSTEGIREAMQRGGGYALLVRRT